MKTQYQKELHLAWHHIDLIAAVLLAVGRCVFVDVPSNPYSLCTFKSELISVFCIVQEFKLKTQLARHYATVHGLAVRAGSPRPIMKTRTAFYLCTTPLTRISRRLCRQLMQTRHAARAPFWAINVAAIKQECKHTIMTHSKFFVGMCL